jgi:acetylornithine deacetylase/succinyl-diaminopimelate desuccinylase-like protein
MTRPYGVLRRLGTLLIVCVLMANGCGRSQNPSFHFNWDEVSIEALAYLREYLSIDSTNPPGNVSRAASFLTGLLQKEGIETDVYHSDRAGGKVNFLARLRAEHPKRKPLLLLSHMDIVPAESERWQVDPLSGLEKDGAVWGRGALDMKAMGVLELMALLLTQRSGRELDRDIIMLSVCDEETGGEFGTRWMVENHWEALDPGAVIDEGGFIARNLLTDDGQLFISPSVGEKKVLWLKLKAEGVGGHGSMPHSFNPNLILMDALNQIFSSPPQMGTDPIVQGLKETTGALADNPFNFAITHDTISLTSLSSGVGDPPKVNVIPSVAEATLDCRLLPGTSVEGFIENLTERMSDSRIEIKVVYRPEVLVHTSEEVLPAASSEELVQAIRKVMKKELPGAEFAPILLPGGTDSRFFRARGVPSIGFTPIEINHESLQWIHGDDERIPIDQFKRGVRLLYEIVAELTSPS